MGNRHSTETPKHHLRAVHTPMAAALVCVTAACASPQPAERTYQQPRAAKKQVMVTEQKKDATPLDENFAPTQICQIMTEVEDAKVAGHLGDLATRYLDVLEASPDDVNARFGYYWTERNEKDRWVLFRDYNKENPGSILGHAANCLIYSNWRLAGQETTFCNTLDERYSASALIAFAKADMARQKGDLPAALKSLKKAIKADPKCSVALTAKAQILTEQEKSKKAIKAWDAAIAVSPKCFMCFVGKAELVEKESGMAAALPVWEQALAIVPVHPSTLQRYAQAQTGRDDGAALKAYETAIKVNSDDVPARIEAAKLAQKVGKRNRAITHWEKVVELQPDYSDGWLALSGLYKKKRKSASELAARTEVVRLLPENGLNHLELARIYAKNDEFVDSVDHYTKAVLQLGAPKEGEDPKAIKKAFTDAKRESGELRKLLKIYTKPASGNIGTVVGKVQFRVTQVFEERQKNNRKLQGEIAVELTTDIDGNVIDLKVTNDSLGDPYVLASMIGNLKLAQIRGGRQKVAFALNFE